MKARDISAPMKTVTVGGEKYNLVFSNKAYRIAEDVYADEFRKDIGIYRILEEAAIPRHRAIEALVYGAAKANGCGVSWEEFDDRFTLADLDGVLEVLSQGVTESMPDLEESETKN